MSGQLLLLRLLFLSSAYNRGQTVWGLRVDWCQSFCGRWGVRLWVAGRQGTVFCAEMASSRACPSMTGSGRVARGHSHPTCE